MRYRGHANDGEVSHLRLHAESGSADVLPVLRARGMAGLGRASHPRPCARKRDRRPARRRVPAHLRKLRLHQAPVRPRARRPTRPAPQHAGRLSSRERFGRTGFPALACGRRPAPCRSCLCCSEWLGCASVRRRRRREPAAGRSGSPQNERRVWPLAASPQVDQPIGEQRTPQDEVVRRQWRRVQRLQCQDAIAAARRAESAGRPPPALLSRPHGHRFGLLVELGLAERAAQPVRLPGACQRRGRLSTQLDSLFSGPGSPYRFGHADPSSRGWRELLRGERVAMAVPRTPELRISPHDSLDSYARPWSFDQFTSDAGLFMSHPVQDRSGPTIVGPGRRPTNDAQPEKTTATLAGCRTGVCP